MADVMCVCVLGEAPLRDDRSEYIKGLIPQHQRGSEYGKTFLRPARLPHLHNKQVFRLPQETTRGENRKLPFLSAQVGSRHINMCSGLWRTTSQMVSSFFFFEKKKKRCCRADVCAVLLQNNNISSGGGTQRGTFSLFFFH